MELTHYPMLDEDVFRTRLSNGLPVVLVRRQGFSKRLAYFVTDYGSIHTEFEFAGQHYVAPAGVAHYLEHKMFDMPGGRDVSAEFAAMGAMTNAFTSYDLTAYYFSCTENFEDCLRLLLEFVSTPYFTPESVAKEQGIIDQEIGMNADAPDSRVFEDLMANLYQNHPVRVPILGTSETIREITPEILHMCHQAFYTPGNMMLCIVGDVEPDTVTAIAEEILGTEPREVGKKQNTWEEALTVSQPKVEQQMEVAMPMFSMAFKCTPTENGESGIRREVVADLAAEALFGESSELYLRLYEEGLIDSSFGGGFETIDGCSMLMCSGDSDEPYAVRDAIIAQAKKLVEEGVPEEDFMRMKRSALGRRIRELDSFDSACFRTCAYHLSEFDYFRFPGLYAQLRASEVKDFLAETVIAEHCGISVIYPLHQEEEA